ncbi:MAG: precorrin-2 C(20)-methyltransferase [Desulfoplanes sp.]
MNALGTLYGIGVGPGDPDLLTMAAVKKLAQVDVILAASSSKNEYSLALGIAKPHMPENIRVIMLKFPMTKDKQALADAWAENGRITADILKQGHNAAFLTLGDPMIYSTFGYLLKILKKTHPEIPVEIIPGVTSFQAAAAKTQTILTESGENLVIFSGVGDEQKLDTLLGQADNAVILKSYKNFDILRKTVHKHSRTQSSVFVSRLGLEGERITHNLDEITRQPHYLSLLLVKK